MIRTAAFLGAAIGVIGIAAASAQPARLLGDRFLAQQVDPKKKVVPGGRGGSQQQQQGLQRQQQQQGLQRMQQQQGLQRQQQQGLQRQQQQGLQRQQQQQGLQRQQQQPVVNRNVNVERNINRNVNTGRNFRPGVVGGNPAGVGSAQFKRVGPGGPVGGPQFHRAGGPGQIQKFGGAPGGAKFIHGPGQVSPYKAVNVPMVKIGNKIAPVWKGQKKFYYGGKWKTFVPLAAIGAVAIGGAYYYADGYLSLARPYCAGITPEGCRLNWQRVEFEEGDSDWQCVQYCRRPGAPPPARTVALVALPPMTQGNCEAAIFSEPGFGGTNATANDEQPRLSELGWRDQIASIKIYAGTWDFFAGEDFTGEVVRFSPGEYADLGPEWSRKTGSFMCVQP